VKKALLLMAVLAIVAGLAAGVWWGISHSPAAQVWLQAGLARAKQAAGEEAEADTSGVVASGFLEAETVEVRAERGGRVLIVSADEGDFVAQDQILVQLDASLM
jgi:multidrug efflux pump subunit AcrA (membrane-fusion protein)